MAASRPRSGCDTVRVIVPGWLGTEQVVLADDREGAGAGAGARVGDAAAAAPGAAEGGGGVGAGAGAEAGEDKVSDQCAVDAYPEDVLKEIRRHAATAEGK